MPTVISLGMIESESKGFGGAVSATETVAVADTTVLSVFVHTAEMVVVPTLAPVTTPFPDGRLQVMDATDGMLEVHVKFGELVTSSVSPVAPDVPIAMNCPVWPEADSPCVPGVMVSAVIGSEAPVTTVNVAVAEATVLSGLV